MRLLVTGGRDMENRALVFQTLDILDRKCGITVLIHGDAAGLDTLAKQWAQLRGVPEMAFPAHWPLFGPRAGTMRNSTMLREGAPDMGIAFPGGRGTADMVRKLKDAKIPTLEGRWKLVEGVEAISWRFYGYHNSRRAA